MPLKYLREELLLFINSYTKRKTGKLARRPVPIGDTERHTVVRFGFKFALVAKYLDTVCGSKSEK